MPSYPTIVPQTDITRDGLNQFDQAVQQGDMDAFDVAAKAGQDQIASYQPPPPNGLTPDDPAAAATAKAVASGADPANLADARRQLGSQAYTNLCEKFVENASGKDGQFASAIDAWNQQPDRQQRDASQIRPGDLVYYGPSAENGYYGHAAIYSGQGKVISATSNGVKETPAQGYFGAPMLGYIPAGDNQQLAPSPMTAPQWGPNYQPPSVAAPGGENYGHLSHPLSTEDGLFLFDRAVQQGNDTLDQIQSTVGQAASGLGSAVQGAMSKVTGIQPDQPVGPDNQGNLGLSPEQQAALTKPLSEKGPGDVATVLQTAAQPLEDAANALNPKNIGNAAASAVLSAEGKPMAPEASFPVVTGASDIASSLTAPGGVLPKAGELAAGAKAAPSMADAFRAVADHLEGKGIGLLGPAAGERAPSDVVAGMGVNPQPLVDALSNVREPVANAFSFTGEQLNRLLAPAKNLPADDQASIAQWANDKLRNAAQAESVALKGELALGKQGTGLNTADAMATLEGLGHFGADASPAAQQFAKEWVGLSRQLGDTGRQMGTVTGDVTELPGVATHVPHFYDSVPEGVTPPDVVNPTSPGKIGTKGYFSHERVFNTLPEAQANGFNPINSVSGPLATTVKDQLDAIANATLIENLKGSGSVLPLGPEDRLLPGNVDLGVYSRQFQGSQGPQQLGEVIKNMVSPSAMSDAPILGGIMKGVGVLKENLFTLSGFHMKTEFQQVYRANRLGDAPGIIARGVYNTVVPGAMKSFRINEAPIFEAAAGAGVSGLSGQIARGPDVEQATLAGLKGALIRGGLSGAEGTALGYGSAKVQGQDDLDALKRGLVAGGVGAILGPTLGKAFTTALWERAVPTLKVGTYQALKDGGLDGRQVATFVNQTYGGQNLTAIARSRTVQDVLRVAALSPDWWEGWARQIGSAFKPGELGGMSRAFWLRTAAIDGAFTLEGLNLALNGHLTNGNEPGRELDLETTGLYQKLGQPLPDGQRQYIDTLGPLKAIATLASGLGHGNAGAIGDFLSTRAGLGPQAIGTAVTNKDFADKPIVDPGTPWYKAGPQDVAATGARLAPIGVQQANQMAQVGTTSPDLSQTPAVGKGPLATAVTELTGMRTSAGPAPNVLYGQRDRGLYDIKDKNPGVYSVFKTAGMDAQFDQPPASFKQIQLNPSEQLAWQQARVDFLNKAVKPGEFAKIQALKPGERDAVLNKILSDADKVAAGTVLGKLSSAQIDARMQARGEAGKPAARKEAQQQPYNPPQFTAPAAR